MKDMTRDMTKGSPAKLILYFTIPLLIGNIFQQLYSMADTMIVGRTIGVDALAAVGATGSLMFLVIGFAQGLTSGFSVITAQRFGAGDEKGVRKSVTTSIVLSIIITIILTIFSVLTVRTLLELLETPSDIIEGAYSYIVVIFYGIYASLLFNLLSNIIRALGDSKTPLYFLIIACVINVVLDFVFILYFSMGVAGAAWATIIAQTVSGVLCFIYMIKKFPILKFEKSDWELNKNFVFLHLKVGIPMAFQASIIAIGAMALQFALNKLGSTAVAAFTASQRIDILTIQPLMSFGITMATYSAQNYGANEIKRIGTGIKQCCIMSVSFSLICGFVIIILGKSIVKLFVGEGQQNVIDLAQEYLVINCSMYLLLALLFIFRYTLQGLGKSLIPTFAGIMELVMRTFAAIFLANLIGFTGICMASPIAWLGAVIPLIISFILVYRKLKIHTLEN